MSLPLPILLSLTSGPGKARMKLECEIEGGGYRLFARERRKRWAVLLPGAPSETESRALTRQQAISAAMLAGFSLGEVERAIRKAESRP